MVQPMLIFIKNEKNLIFLFFLKGKTLNKKYVISEEEKMFKKYPVIIQKDSKDCGVCCLAMIIKYYQGNIPLSIIRNNTKTDMKGTTAYHLINYASEIGFNARGIRCDIDSLINKEKTFPCIANVTINNSYKHYIVIYKVLKSKILVCDPAYGLKTIDINEFKKIYNEIILEFYPETNIPYMEEKSIVSFTIDLLKKQKKLSLSVVIVSVLMTLYAVFNSFFVKFIIDSITHSKSFLTSIFIIFTITYFIKCILNYIRNYILIYINQRVDYVLTTDTFKHILSLPYQYYRNHPTGDIISRINDLDNIKIMISKISMSLFIDSFLTLISFVMMFIINKYLALISFLMMLLYLMIVILFRDKLVKNINLAKQSKADKSSYMVEAITGIETVRGLNIESFVLNKFIKKQQKELSNILRLDKLYILESLFKDIVNDLGYVILLTIGALFVSDNKLSLGELMASESLLIYFLEPIKNIINLDSNIKEATSSLRRMLDLYIDNKEDGYINELKIDNICFKKLRYTYNDEKYILDNINLTIKSNDKVMVIGKSGSGKSTMFKLLMNYYKINRNMIFLNEKDINDYTNEVIRNNVSYISQNEILFNDTIYNNLKLDRNIDDEFIYKICRACKVDDIVEKRNLGFNTLIEENGFNISGGEKQRIILARLLLNNSKVFIIDEGLNELDVSLERKILKNVFKIFPDRIFIIISHRLENLDLYNHLLELNDGKIIKDKVYNT